MSLCMAGVETDGGPWGRDEERFVRRRADEASLRGSSGASERSAASAREDMVVVKNDCEVWWEYKNKLLRVLD